MPIARLDIAPASTIKRTSVSMGLAATVSGNMALIDGAPPTWQNLVDCAIQADGSLKKTTGTVTYDSGATSVETIAAGDGYVQWLTPVPPGDDSIPYVEWSDRVFMAGLTTLASITSHAQIEFGIELSNEGTKIFESGVIRANIGAPRNNGVYYVGIENGQVVYRVDGDVVYRSGVTISYPLHFGPVFWSNLDRIGGAPASPYVWTATGDAMFAQGNGTFTAGATTATPTYTTPAERGRLVIRGSTSNYVANTMIAEILALYPGLDDGFPRAAKIRELTPEYPVREAVFQDLSGQYALTALVEPIRRWEIIYAGLSTSDCQWLDGFHETHRNNAYWFYFKDEHAGITYAFVRFEKYERDHRKVYSRDRRVQLIRRPF